MVIVKEHFLKNSRKLYLGIRYLVHGNFIHLCEFKRTAADGTNNIQRLYILCKTTGVKDSLKSLGSRLVSGKYHGDKVFAVMEMASDPLTYKRTGLLDRLEKAWSQDGGNMRVFAHEVTC